MKKLGFSLSGSYSVPMPEVIRMLAETGFGAVSPLWQRDVSLEDTVRAAENNGMVLQSLHGPLRGLPGMGGMPNMGGMGKMHGFGRKKRFK